MNYRIIFATIALVLCAQAFAKTEAADTTLWANGLEMTLRALNSSDGQLDISLYKQGLKEMEKAFKIKSDHNEWCQVIAGYYNRIDEKAYLAWLEKGMALGNIYCAISLYIHYHPGNEPYSILSPKKEWDKFFKARDKCYKYAAEALKLPIPDDFDDYRRLGEVAEFVNNESLATKYFAIAADHGEYDSIKYVILHSSAITQLTSPEAMYKVAQSLKNNNDEKNRNTALKLFEKSAGLSYAPAQYMMGQAYRLGYIVKPDKTKAEAWYFAAVSNGYDDAVTPLAQIYADGSAVDSASDDLLKIFRQYADKGHAYCLLIMGHCSLNGYGVPTDPTKAREYFRKGFNLLRNDDNQRVITSSGKIFDLDYLLGIAYYAESNPKALPLLEASLKGKTFYTSQRSDLLQKLATCYREGKCGAAIDTEKADKLLQQAHEL